MQTGLGSPKNSSFFKIRIKSASLIAAKTGTSLYIKKVAF